MVKNPQESKHQPQNPHQKSIDRIRNFNKYIFNRIIVPFTESGRGPFSVVYHIGRRSGRMYRTPVLATYIGKTIIIPLSYGENVDWLRNVLERGGCEIVRKKKRIGATKPEVIDSASALVILPEKRRRLFERFETEKFVRLHAVKKE